MKRAFVVITALIALAGCGGRQTLKPRPGVAMPPKAAAAKTTPTAQDLMTPTVQARPNRNDELLKHSEERRDDHFDLPPGN